MGSKERAWVRFAYECQLIYGPFVSPCRHVADPTYCPTLGAYYPYDNDKKFLCSRHVAHASKPHSDTPHTHTHIDTGGGREGYILQLIHIHIINGCTILGAFWRQNDFSTFPLRGRRMSMEKKKYCRFC